MNATQTIQLAQSIQHHYVGKQVVTSQDIYNLAGQLLGVSQSSGDYNRQDIYNALEIAHNLKIMELYNTAKFFDPNATIDSAKFNFQLLSNQLDMLPTHAVRNEEQVAYQQFSTPPHYAYLVAWLCNFRNNDILLEPSAGLLGLAIHGINAGIEVAANEMEQSRLGLIITIKDQLFRDKKVWFYKHDAANLHVHAQNLEPTIVLMNPPFSSNAATNVKDNTIGALHVERALQVLAPNGRLVAIVSGGRPDNLTGGMHFHNGTYRDWWQKIGLKYNIRANVGMTGGIYRKFGTGINTRIIIIDKTGRTIHTPVQDDIINPLQAFDLLWPIRIDRPHITEKIESIPSNTPRAIQQIQNVFEGIEVDFTKDVPVVLPITINESLESSSNLKKYPLPKTYTEEVGKFPSPEKIKELQELQKPSVPEPAPIVIPDPIPSEHIVPGSTKEELEEDPEAQGVFEVYKPFLQLTGAKPHEAPLVESDAMRLVQPPIPKAKVFLPKHAVYSGRLSDVQIERIVYAAHNTTQYLRDGTTRKASFVGDGTGFGKGATLAGCIMNYKLGYNCTRFLWLSKSQSLIEATKRDWDWVGGDVNDVFALEKEKKAELSREEGILFTTYTMNAIRQTAVKTDLSVDERGQLKTVAKVKGIDRFQQILDYKPEVIILDECFPYNTMIVTNEGILPIGEIVEKQLDVLVLSYNKIQGVYEWKRIVKHRKNPLHGKKLVQVHHEAGILTCTDNHKIWTNKGYVQAKDLKPDDKIQRITGSHLYSMWDSVRSEAQAEVQSEQVLQSGLHGKIHSSSPKPQRTGDSNTKDGSSNIQKTQRATRSAQFQAYEGTQSHEQSRNFSQNDSHATSQENLDRNTWWQWFYNRAAIFIGGITLLGRFHGISHWFKNYLQQRQKLSNSLLCGYSDSRVENSNRSGWENSQAQEVALSGSSQNRSPQFSRVDRVEVLEPGRYGEFINVYGEGEAVYDFEIEGNHNYIANGILVSNCHEQGNATNIKGKRGTKKASKKALMGIELQKQFPNAHIIYASATGATEVNNLAYCAERLGLCGEGVTSFPTLESFVKQISAGGMLAMELVAKDMKAMGLYGATNLSYAGTEFHILEHILSDKQVIMYNHACEAWRIVMASIEEAMELNGSKDNGDLKKYVRGQYYGAIQRFFNQLLTSMQTPTAIGDMEKELAAGNACVIQLVNTNEAATERAVAKAVIDGTSLDDLDITPRDTLMNLVDTIYPIIQYEYYEDERGSYLSRPVKDAEGNPAVNPLAIKMKQDLLEKVSNIVVPEGALDMIINHFGPDKIAEITGRRARYILKDGPGSERIRDTRTRTMCDLESNEFMDDKRCILIFSGAGNTGRSWQADKRCKNQRRRIHYVLQAGWRADEALQGLGRTNRTAQVSGPVYKLVTTNLKGQKRFITSIARRIEQLGSLTKGNRKAASGGLFSAEDNLENEYATAAIWYFFSALYHGRLDADDLSYSKITKQMGLNLEDKEDGFTREKMPDITTFLNRLLCLDCDMQDKVFDTWHGFMINLIEDARENGTLDMGVEKITAHSIRKVSEIVVYTDIDTNAKTKVVELLLQHRVKKGTWQDLRNGYYRTESRSGFYYIEKKNFMYFAKNTLSGKVYAYYKNGTSTSKNGEVHKRVKRINCMGCSRHNEEEVVKNGDIRISNEAAKILWDQEVAGMNDFEEETLYLLTGANLPVWDKIEGNDCSIMVAETDEKERMIGRVIPARFFEKTMKNLGAIRKGIYLSTAEIIDRILKKDAQVTLANGYVIQRRMVSKEWRLQIRTKGDYYGAQDIKKQGVLSEYHSADREQMYYIPTGPAMFEIFRAVTKYRPAVSIHQDLVTTDLLASSPEEEKKVSMEPLPSKFYNIDHLVELVDLGIPYEVHETGEIREVTEAELVDYEPVANDTATEQDAKAQEAIAALTEKANEIVKLSNFAKKQKKMEEMGQFKLF